MNQNIYLSYSAINDFLRCPLYYDLKYRYRNPQNGYRVDLVNPALALGIVFERVVKRVRTEPEEFRTQEFALSQFERVFAVWYKAFSFKNSSQVSEFKERGIRLVKRFMNNPHFVFGKTFFQDFLGVDYPLKPNVVICGNADWIEKNPDGTLIVVDFKTGSRQEKEDSLQLPIYKYLVENKFGLPVSRTFYWYLERDEQPREVFLNSYEDSIKRMFSVCEKVLDGLKNDQLKCVSQDFSCNFCQPFLMIKKGLARHVFTDHIWKKDFFTI